jgi:dTDP-4-amino-4,6-dideoxygalactose transaminase
VGSEHIVKIPRNPILTPRLLFKQKAAEDIHSFFEKLGAKNYLFYGYGRIALLDGLKILGCKKGENVLIPSYICNVAVEPFYEIGVHVRFYKILPNLQPDLVDIETKIDRKTKAILLVNYFGFPNKGLEEIQNICKRYKIYLIEDNAHGVLSRKSSRLLGTFGDIGFASLWKVFPIPNGAVFFINNDELLCNIENSSLSPLKSQNRLRLRDYRYCIGSIMDYLEIRYGLSFKRIRNMYSAVFCVERDANEQFQNSKVPMSKISLKVIQHIDPNEVIKLRRDNYEFWLERMLVKQGIQIIFEGLPDGVCPQVFPIVAESADHFRQKMLAKGIPVFNWPYLPKEVENNKEYQIANSLAKDLLILPVHQNINQDYLKEIS